jgi:hypothetical protein
MRCVGSAYSGLLAGTVALDRMLKDKGQPLSSISGFLATQLSHVPWEGFSFYDFVFPLFLVVTGVSIVLALPRIVENESKAQAHLGVLRRALTLYLLGVIFYGGISQYWSDVRFVGISQRIAICYLFAALLFINLDWRGLIVALVALLGTPIRRVLSGCPEAVSGHVAAAPTNSVINSRRLITAPEDPASYRLNQAHRKGGRYTAMSALGQKRNFAVQSSCSLYPEADI